MTSVPPKNRPRPADRDDLPRAGAALREKIAQHLLAAGRQKASEVGDEREEVSFAAYRGGREAHRDEQSGKERKKQVEGRSLGDRIAARKYAAESAPQALGRGSHEHRAALYEISAGSLAPSCLPSRCAALQTKPMRKHFAALAFTAWVLAGSALAIAADPAAGQAQPAPREVWKPVAFAIVKYNDEAPKSWNLYHTEKKGLLLLHLWKRYLLVNVNDEEVFDIDPSTIKVAGENIEWSLADKPHDPIEALEWKTRDIGPMQRVAFRLGKGGHMVELQIPLLMNGKTAY